jgi:hypothetical protein
MLEPGIYENVSAEEYHSDPCDRPSLSNSIAKILCERSPAHAWQAHPKLGGDAKAPTKMMDRGTLRHALLLRNNIKVSVIPFENYKKKAAQELRDSAREQGALPILERELVEDKETVECIRDRLRLKYGLELTGKNEVVVVWDELADDETTVRCRGQIDHLLLPRILDFKFPDNASPDSVDRTVSSLDYQIQGAAYTSAIETLFPDLAGRVTFELYNCEAFKPYASTHAMFTATMRELGRLKWRRAINTWARCLRTNHWPDYPSETLHVEAKPWQLDREMERAYANDPI